MAEETTKGRTLPHNLEAEKSVLGAVLLDNQAVNAAAELLTGDDFYGEAHRLIFAAMCALSEVGAPIDAVTLAERLARADQLERAGGAEYLSMLVDGLPRALNVAQYARIVKDKASLRNLISSANNIITAALSQEDETDEIIDAAERRIFEIAEDKVKRGFLSIHDLAEATMHELEELHERREFITGVPTGFRRLDTLTAGLQGGDLIILAARPSMGKTALALNIAQHVALRHGGSVGIFSLEMSTQQLIRRLMSAEAHVDNHKLATGFLSDKDLNDLLNALEFLSTAKMFVDDTANPSLLEMRSKARRLKAEHGLDLIVVDYLQLMSLGGRYENRNLEIGAISRALKGLAKELEVPVIALSQLSRAPESRAEHRPQLSDLRECVTGDTLVQLADGRRVPIEKLVGETPEVIAMEAGGSLVRARSDKVWKVGTRTVFELRTATGRRVRATPEHRMYAHGGWLTVGELRPGDRVALAGRIPQPEASRAWPVGFVQRFGQSLGDEERSLGRSLRPSPSMDTSSDFARRLLEHRPQDKRVPDDVFQLANAQLAQLLRHLWLTGGGVRARTDGPGTREHVYFATPSERLALDVADMLLRFGVLSSVKRDRRNLYRPGFRVVVHPAMVTAFLREIGVAAKYRDGSVDLDQLPLQDLSQTPTTARAGRIASERVDARAASGGGAAASYGRVADASHAVLTRAGRRTARRAMRRRLAAHDLERFDPDLPRWEATDSLFWDPILSIEPAGEEEVYDLTVPGPASWVGNSLIQHNSGNLEQDADVVAFIYREEVYNPDPTVQGLAELIIAKQRNGPIGVVPLAFLKQFTAFKDREDRDDPGEPWG